MEILELLVRVIIAGILAQIVISVNSSIIVDEIVERLKEEDLTK